MSRKPKKDQSDEYYMGFFKEIAGEEEEEGEEEMDEGCLSVPGVYDRVRRAETIELRALDRNGDAFEMQADGLLAICIQHEMDHLRGKLFVDYLSQLKRQRIRKKLEKTHRRRA